jgi:hypothetical protein
MAPLANNCGTVIALDNCQFQRTVEFDVPSGKHCTNEPDSVPSGATLSPLTGSGSSAHTLSNHYVFTWNTSTVLASGVLKTFNDSTDSNASSFTSATSLVASDSICR